MAKESRNFRLSSEGLALIRALAKRLGISQAAVVEVAVRKLGREEGMENGLERDGGDDE